MPSNDPDASERFYSNLFGEEMARTPIPHKSFHTWASSGVKLRVETPYYNDQPVMCGFLVDDINSAVETLKEVGGKVLKDAFQIQMNEETFETLADHYKEFYGNPLQNTGDDLGTCVIMSDPGGNAISLLQVPRWVAREYDHGLLTDFHRQEIRSSAKAGKAYAAKTRN